MIGAIAGDVIGSVFERHNITRAHGWELFDGEGPSWFTDDSVLTAATADAILHGTGYGEAYRRWYRWYPRRGYGPMFATWAASETRSPYGSFGNGSAMRVSPIGWAFGSLEEVLSEARSSAIVTHDHEEGIRGAQAVAGSVFLARTGVGKPAVRRFIEEHIGYDLSRSVDEIRPGYRFDASCQGSVPQALTAFLESDSWEGCVRTAISLGGDSDTIACIAGAVAEAHHGAIPGWIETATRERLDSRLRRMVDSFSALCQHPVPSRSRRGGGGR